MPFVIPLAWAMMAYPCLLAGQRLAAGPVGAAVLGGTALAGWVGVVQPFTLVDGVLVRLLGAESAMPAAPPGVLGGAVFAAVAVAVVLGCYALLVLRYRRVSVS